MFYLRAHHAHIARTFAWAVAFTPFASHAPMTDDQARAIKSSVLTTGRNNVINNEDASRVVKYTANKCLIIFVDKR